MQEQMKNELMKIINHPAMLLAYRNRPWRKVFTEDLDNKIKDARWLFSNPNVKNDSKESSLGNIKNGKHPYTRKIDSVIEFIIYISEKAGIDPLKTIKSQESGGCSWEERITLLSQADKREGTQAKHENLKTIFNKIWLIINYSTHWISNSSWLPFTEDYANSVYELYCYEIKKEDEDTPNWRCSAIKKGSNIRCNHPRVKGTCFCGHHKNWGLTKDDFIAANVPNKQPIALKVI